MVFIRVGLILVFSLLASSLPTTAQNADYGHVHMNVPYPLDAVSWYIDHMGCTAFARKDACLIGTIELRFAQAEPTGGSEGSGIDHIGFSFRDLTEKMRALETASVTILEPLREPEGLFKHAFIEDPWGTKIEIVEDQEFLGFHHVHLRSDSPKTTLSWYKDTFGGQDAQLRGIVDALRYGTVWLIVSPAPSGHRLLPSRGRSIDHLGFNYPDLDQATRQLRTKGVTVTDPAGYTDSIGVPRKFAFTTGPNDVRIELIQPKV